MNYSHSSFWLIRPYYVIQSNFNNSRIGPIWLNAGPAILIVLLTFIFSNSKDHTFISYFPYCAIGYLLWTMTGEVFASSFDFIRRNRGLIENSGMHLNEIILHEVVLNFYKLVFRIPIVIASFFAITFTMPITSFLLAAFGLVLIVITQFIVLALFGVFFHKFNDFRHLVDAIMRVGFLLTPVFWETDRFTNSPLFYFLVQFNPFWHYIQIVRAPILGLDYPTVSIMVVLSIIVFLLFLSWVFRKSIIFIATLAV